jgi:hypothetical protein
MESKKNHAHPALPVVDGGDETPATTRDRTNQRAFFAYFQGNRRGAATDRGGMASPVTAGAGADNAEGKQRARTDGDTVRLWSRTAETSSPLVADGRN